MYVNMLNLPVQPPIYQDFASLPDNANEGALAVVLASPPELYLYDGTTWNEVGAGGTPVIPSNAPPNEFCNGLDSGGNLLYAQPAFSNIAGVATVTQGGTGQSTYTNGQLLIGNTATSSLTKATLTAGSGISITNGNGSITIALSGSGIVTSVEGTSLDQVLVNGGITPATGTIILSLPQSIGTGSSPTFAGLLLSGLTASQAVVTDGSKNLVSLAYLASGGTSNLVSRDVNGTTVSNNFISNQDVVVSAAGTTVLSASSSARQILTGTSTQTFTLPNATTLYLGTTYQFINNSTGLLTINDNSGGLITTVLAGVYKEVYVTNIGSAAGTWGSTAAGVSSLTGTASQIDVNGGLGPATGSITLSFPSTVAITKLGVGGTAPGSNQVVVINTTVTASSARATGLRLQGTLTASANSDTLGNFLIAATTFASGTFTGLLFRNVELRNDQVTKTGTGTVTDAYGVYSTGFASLATNQYAGYFINGTGGTTNQALYADNLSIGYTAVNPPTNGAIISGSVGVGINSASDKLHLSVGNIEGIRIQSTNCGALKFYTTSADSNSRNWMLAQNWSIAGDLCLVRSSAAGGAPTATTTMIINNSGNVGFRVTPSYPMDISYTNSGGGVNETGLRIANTSVTNSTQLNLSGFRSWSVMVNGSLGSPAGALAFNDNSAGAMRMCINSSGNVGIATNNPSTAKLVFGGSPGAEGLDLSSSDQYANMRVIRNSLSGIDKHMYIGLASGATSYLYFYADNSQRMVLTGTALTVTHTVDIAAGGGIGTLTVGRGSTGNQGTAVFRGTSVSSHFNYSTPEDTYIRGGYTSSVIYVGDVGSSTRIGNTGASFYVYSATNSTLYNGVNFRFYSSYDSGQVSLGAGITSVNHGLGGMPSWYQVYIECISTSGSANYQVGDRIMMANYFAPSDSTNSAWCTASQLGFSSNNRIVVANKTTGVATAVTLSSFRAIFLAWRAI